MRKCLILGLMVLACGAVGPQELRSPAGRRAQAKYEAAMAKAEADYQDQRAAAAKIYAADLQVAMKDCMKAGDLDGANAVKLELDYLRDPPESGLKGNWEAHFPNGAFRVYHFERGTVTFKENGQIREAARVQHINDDDVCMFEKAKEVDRFTLVNGRLYVELYWDPPKIGAERRGLTIAVPATQF